MRENIESQMCAGSRGAAAATRDGPVAGSAAGPGLADGALT
jgi:hypothetical protein